MDFLRNRKIPRLNRANNAAKKASLAGGFFGDVGLLRKIGNNEWNHHGQW